MYTRKCPSCSVDLIYHNIVSYKNATKRDSMCRSCSSKIRSQKYPSLAIEKINDEIRNGERKSGFFGRNHTDSTIEKLKKADKVYTKKEEFRKNISNLSAGEKNGMFGKSFYDVWVEKYGISVADEKLSVMKEKISKKTTGSNNPMYGTITPEGSGNGWSGWYNGWYFRSILELSYMINVIERFGLEWEGGEKREYRIKYIDSRSIERTYTPDFIISGKYMIEMKPKKLWGQIDVQLKAAAAKEFCESNSMIYKMTYCTKIDNQKIKELLEAGELIFIEKYKNKYDERYNK